VAHRGVHRLGSWPGLVPAKPAGAAQLAYSADGSRIAVAVPTASRAALGCCTSRSTVAVWDARSGSRLFASRRADHATAIASSPDSRLLGVGTEDGQVLFLGARDGRPRESPLHVASGNIDQLSFAPGGTRIAAGSFDLSTTMWDLRTHKQLGDSFPVRSDAVPAPLFEPNGRLLIDYLSDAAEWPTDARSWERFACQVAGRDLTPAEWRDVLPRRPYRHVCG
jgi:WD40 repeat protein